MNRSALASATAAQVVAISGHEVEWTGRNWMVDGKSPRRFIRQADSRPGRRPAGSRSRPTRSWSSLAMMAIRPRRIGPLVLVSPDRIIGRAWAQFYPVWDRHLL